MSRRVIKKRTPAKKITFLISQNPSTPLPPNTVVISLAKNSAHYIENLVAIVNSFYAKNPVVLLYSNNSNESESVCHQDVFQVNSHLIPVPKFFSALGISTSDAFSEELELRRNPDARAEVYTKLVHDAFPGLTDFKIVDLKPKKKAKKNA